MSNEGEAFLVRLPSGQRKEVR